MAKRPTEAIRDNMNTYVMWHSHPPDWRPTITPDQNPPIDKRAEEWESRIGVACDALDTKFNALLAACEAVDIWHSGQSVCRIPREMIDQLRQAIADAKEEA